MLRAKEEEGRGREDWSREPKRSSKKGRSVTRQPRTYCGETDPGPSGVTWSARKEAKDKPKEKREPGRGGDRDRWKNWKGDWRSRTEEVVRGTAKEDRRGGRRVVKDSLSPRYKKGSGSK